MGYSSLPFDVRKRHLKRLGTSDSVDTRSRQRSLLSIRTCRLFSISPCLRNIFAYGQERRAVYLTFRISTRAREARTVFSYTRRAAYSRASPCTDHRGSSSFNTLPMLFCFLPREVSPSVLPISIFVWFPADVMDVEWYIACPGYCQAGKV